MASRVTKTASNANSGGRQDMTHATMMSSRCPDDDNRTPCRQPHPCRSTASPPPRLRSPTPATSLVFLTVVVVVVAGLAGPVQAGLMDFSAPEVIQYGTCAQPKDQQPFDFRQFNGLWYQVEMVPNSYMEPKTCITLHFDWNGEAYNVTTKGLNEYNEEVQQDAIVTKEQPQNPATSRPYLKIRASGVPPVPYHVVKTDYRRFACVYSCFELFSLMFEAFSVLSRHAEVDDATHQACHRAFAALDLDLTRLHPVHQGEMCLREGLEGSGEEPPRRDDEDEEDENALVALTSEEVNPSGAPMAPSDQRSDQAVEEHEGEALMEELEEEAEEEDDKEVQEDEKDVGEAQEEETGGSSLGNDMFSFSEIELVSSSNHAEGETQEHSDRTPEISDLEGNNSPGQSPKMGHRGKKTRGGRRRGKGRRKEEDTTPSVTSRDQQLYLDDLHLDFLYYPEEERRGGGGGGDGAEGGRGEVRGGDERDEASFPTHDHLSLHGGAGGVKVSAPLLLLALLTLALCARVPPTS